MNIHSKQGSKFKVLVYEEELNHIAGWVEDCPNLETGGDLFGFWTHSGFPVIQFILGPGKRSRHNHTSFYQEKDYLIKSGSLLRSKYGLQHIGEWHSHHQLGLAQPSQGDEHTVFRALDRYKFPKFLLCIANLRPNSGSFLRKSNWTVNIGSFLFTHSIPNYQIGQWVVLPGSSPIRSTLEDLPKGSRNLMSGDLRTLLSGGLELQLSDSWKVDRTTLEAEILEPNQPIEIAEHLWYSKPEGQNLLREIHTDLKQAFNDCQMFRTATGKIYFIFKQGQDSWRVELPNNFPDSSPILRVNEERSILIEKWSNQTKLINALRTEFIK